jgi:hypothetical protein
MRCLRMSSVTLYDINAVVIKTRAKNTPVHRHYGVDQEVGEYSLNSPYKNVDKHRARSCAFRGEMLIFR